MFYVGYKFPHSHTPEGSQLHQAVTGVKNIKCINSNANSDIADIANTDTVQLILFYLVERKPKKSPHLS